MVFNPGASAYTIAATTRAGLTFSGAGITNNSGVTQNFVSTSFDGDTSTGVINFSGNASAGDGTKFTNNDGVGFRFDVGTTNFGGHSSGGHATLINRGGTGPGRYGGQTNFYGGKGGYCTVVVEGPKVIGAHGGSVFVDPDSDLENATLIVSGGAGHVGGTLTFDAGSSGGSARIELFGNGTMDISLAAFAPEVAVGSIEGNGKITLGDSTLNVGANNRSTTFTGKITDGNSSDGFGGTLRKTGSGALTLGSRNPYTGGTIIDAGSVVVANDQGSATGTNAVAVNAGTLSGDGAIMGVVTIGTGIGAGASLAPSQGLANPASLTIRSSLTIKADGTFVCRFNTKKARADQVSAKGITLENGAQFMLDAVANKMLTAGQVFILLKNTSGEPISGTFANLPDGSTLNAHGNNLQVSYAGGDGNDLALTVVP